jgi:uncharacterized protein (TIGR02246 family)
MFNGSLVSHQEDRRMIPKRRWSALAVLGLGALVTVLMSVHGGTDPAAAGQGKPAARPTVQEAPLVGGTEVRPADRAAVADVTQGFVQAFERGDAKALAAFWTGEGEFVGGDGTSVRGRAALAKAYAGFFAKNPKVKMEVNRDSLRFLSRDTAVEEGHFKMRKDKTEAPASVRYSALYVREGGKWLLAMLREWPDDGASLRALEWLIGSWEAKGDGVDLRTHYEWDENKAFIRVRFSIREEGRTLTGTEIIGKDPSTGRLRSWIFGSHGGFGQAVWSRDGQKWLQEAEGVQPDGSKLRATNILTRLSDDAFTWQSVNRAEDGEELPDLPPVKVTRVKPK